MGYPKVAFFLPEDFGQAIPRGVKPCPKSGSYLCTGCRNVPQIRGIFLPGVQKRASDSGHISARCAETCLRFRAYFCPVCINPPQIQGIFLPGVHKRA